MDSRTGEILALADHPTFDAAHPADSPTDDRGARSLNLLRAGLGGEGADPLCPHRHRPGDREDQDEGAGQPGPPGPGDPRLLRARPAPAHPRRVLAKSSNIGTVLAADRFRPGELRTYLDGFGLGRRTDVGLGAESPGLLPDPTMWTSQAEDRIAFGQSLSVNAVQIAAAVNTIANHGVRVSPSLVRGTATRDDGARGRDRRADHPSGGQRRRGPADHADDGAGRRPSRRGRAPGPGARLPGGGQDRHRPAGQPEVQLLRRHVHGLLRRVRAGRRPALHDLRGDPRPAERRRRWRRWPARCSPS